jgi:hypothetical protein
MQFGPRLFVSKFNSGEHTNEESNEEVKQAGYERSARGRTRIFGAGAL